MSDRRGETPEQVLKFAPKRKAQSASNPTDDAGNALLAMLQEAAKLSHDNRDSILAVAHKLSLELRAAEDRIRELEGDVQRSRERALHAEQWLERIHTEIEAQLIVPLATIRSEQAPLHGSATR